jgi:hypothetical protein
MITERMQQLAGVSLDEEQLNEAAKTTAALLFASALRYLGSGIPIIKDTSLIKKAAELEQQIDLGRNVSMSDMESVRKRLMQKIDALPGHKRRNIKTYMTKLEQRIKDDRLKWKKYPNRPQVDDWDDFYNVKKRGQLVLKIAKELERLGLANYDDN